MGVISSVGRQIQDDSPMVYIQTDAPINPGNSGGPLVDTDGNVIGINTFILSKSGGSEGIGFAIPSNIVRNVYNQLKKDGHVHRGEIGISVRTITPQLADGLDLPREEGVIVEDVDPDSAAAQAGLKVGDIVLALEGRPLQNARQLLIQVYNFSIGDTVKLDVLRGEDQKVSIPVKVSEREDDPGRFADMVTRDDNLIPRLGILGLTIDKKLGTMLPDLRYTYGVVVAARAADNPYEGAGLQPGDVIISMNSKIVDSIETLRKMLDGLQAGQPVVLQVQRSDHLKYLVLELY
jgi:serine protease Do